MRCDVLNILQVFSGESQLTSVDQWIIIKIPFHILKLLYQVERYQLLEAC
jgi:hypothetical protein